MHSYYILILLVWCTSADVVDPFWPTISTGTSPPPGSEHVSDAAECGYAAQELSLPFIQVTTRSAGPPGCVYIISSQALTYNSDLSVTTSASVDEIIIFRATAITAYNSTSCPTGSNFPETQDECHALAVTLELEDTVAEPQSVSRITSRPAFCHYRTWSPDFWNKLWWNPDGVDNGVSADVNDTFLCSMQFMVRLYGLNIAEEQILTFNGLVATVNANGYTNLGYLNSGESYTVGAVAVSDGCVLANNMGTVANSTVTDITLTCPTFEPTMVPTSSEPSFAPVSSEPSSEPSPTPVTQVVTLEGDFDTVVTNETLFLEECTTQLSPVECVSVASGSILLTIRGDSADVDAAVSDIETNGLDLPSFEALTVPESEDSGSKFPVLLITFVVVGILISCCLCCLAKQFYDYEAYNPKNDLIATQAPGKVVEVDGNSIRSVSEMSMHEIDPESLTPMVRNYSSQSSIKQSQSNKGVEMQKKRKPPLRARPAPVRPLPARPVTDVRVPKRQAGNTL